MRKPGGWTFITDGNTGLVEEGETFSCNHCNRVTMIKPRQNPEDIGGFCLVCAKLICSGCVGRGCDPLEAKLARAEAQSLALKSYGL